MLKNVIKMTSKGAENRVYQFECDPSSPLGEVYDSLHIFMNEILRQINESAQKFKCEEEKKDIEEKEKRDIDNE